MAAKKLPKDALVTEILQKVSSAKTKKEKIELLQEYNNNALRAILIINFDESLEFLLPEGEVPFTPNDAPIGTEHTRLTHEYKGLYKYFKGGDNKNSWNWLIKISPTRTTLLLANFSDFSFLRVEVSGGYYCCCSR